MSPNKHDDEYLAHDGHPEDATAAAASAPVSEARQLPLRGLAMILAAVAVLLAAWALFAGLRGDDSDTTPVAGEGAGPTAATSTEVSPAAPATTPRGETAPQPAPATPAADPGSAAPAQPAAPPAPAGDPRTVTVHTLNNSTIQGLANRVADKLTGQGWKVGEVGNLAETYLPASAVYYTAGNPTEEAAAREVGAALGIPANPRTPELGSAPSGGVVVVLTGDVNL
ncbi:LytR C-terminal domain-containing protein [Corynebacterium sp. P5875]|uniref:LytR C-terminal domain-containing protein n=1 Tax=Corynebacterium antarcticum TaxID=2800405 RepID=A0A9Q4CDF6_9CORY|nr:LytR C-terminal domain-containing protein [Corynebacterium antarcticum]MCX7538859.1 LytR C-terminal domain-containing protein [Corynebacterium antarcticum]